VRLSAHCLHFIRAGEYIVKVIFAELIHRENIPLEETVGKARFAIETIQIEERCVITVFHVYSVSIIYEFGGSMTLPLETTSLPRRTTWRMAPVMRIPSKGDQPHLV